MLATGRTFSSAAIALLALTLAACESPAEPRTTVDPCLIARPDFGVAGQADIDLFAYDTNAPLNLEKVVEDTVRDVEISEISFDSPRGGRVTGLLFDPITRAGPNPGVVLMHPMPGDARLMTNEAQELAQFGAVVIAIDAPFARRGGPTLQFTTQDRDEQVQLIVDLQRAVDVLLAHPTVDAERIAFQGAGYGGAMGALLVGIDHRFEAAVLRTPYGGLVTRYTGPEADELAELDCETRAAWLAAMTPIEPIRFVGHASNTRLLLQAGQSDNNVPVSDVTALQAAAPQPKTVMWYAAGHGLNPQAATDRLNWLHEVVSLEPGACTFNRPAFGVASEAERALFAYDVNAPLDLQKTSMDTAFGVATSTIRYASPDGGMVTGYMFEPVGRTGARPGIILLHGLPGNAQQQMPLGQALSSAGAVVVAINAPFARRGAATLAGAIQFTVQDRAEQIQLIKDLQRAVDVLREHPAVDDERIAFHGVSYGGAMGALFAGIERRIRTAVLMVPDGGLVTHFTQPQYAAVTDALSCPSRIAWMRGMKQIEPIRYVAYAAGTPLLLQNGRYDLLVSESDAEALHAAVPEPSTIQWFNEGHGLNQEALLERHEWLHEQIGIDPMP